ncbi:MAG: O-antigen ligase family protein [Oscillospiraceae bacterium]|nr:O-antigen ligase family protein [Oscillospiraceae bacterium]
MKEKILQGSLFYRLLDRGLEKVTETVTQSGIVRACRFVFGKAIACAEVSVAARASRAVGRWISGGARESLFLGRFLTVKDGSERSRASLCYRAYSGAMHGLFAAARAIRLDRALRGSVFAKPALWCILTVGLAPFLPTMAVLGLVCVGCFALFADMMRRDTVELNYFSGNKYLYAYMLLYVLVTAVFLWRGGSLQVTGLIVVFMLFSVLLMNAVKTRQTLRMMLTLMVAAGAAVALFGLYQFFISGTETASAWVDSEVFDIGVRIYATFGNPNVLGTYFVLLIPLGLALLLRRQGRVSRLLLVLAIALMGGALVLTFSRGAYMGILAALALFFVLLDKRLILPGILAVGVLILLLPDVVTSRFLSIGDMTDTSSIFRVSIWTGAGDMIRNHWLIGIGPGEAAWWAVYPTFALPAVATEHAHNLFLQVLAEFGVVGFGVFLLILIHFYKNTIASFIGGKGERRLIAIAAIAGVTGFLLMGMVDYSLYNFRLRLLFWVILAVGLINRHLKCGEAAEA